MNKAVETAKPYTAAVAHKTEEIIHQIQVRPLFGFLFPFSL
jgi:hypothetical protein